MGMTTSNALRGMRDKSPEDSYLQVRGENMGSESNGCLMRITPLAVWAHKLTSKELYRAIKLQTAFTH